MVLFPRERKRGMSIIKTRKQLALSALSILSPLLHRMKSLTKTTTSTIKMVVDDVPWGGAFNPATPSVDLTGVERIEVLSDMVDDLLLRQFLRKNGPKVDPAEIDAQLKAYGEKLRADGKSLADFYKETGQTEAQVKEAWTTALQLTGYVKLNAPEEQLKAYFTANKDHFDRVEVKVRHIVIRAGKNATPAERVAAREKLEALRAEIAAGKREFAAAAEKYSHCPSATAGGNIGTIYRKGGIVEEPFAKAAFALKVNELSSVIETDFGFHILQVTDRKPGTPTSYDKAATEVLDTYPDDFRAELIAKLRKQGQVQVTVP